MGCDVHVIAQRKVGGEWRTIPMPTEVQNDAEWRHYGTFTLLAGVRDYRSGITPISEPRGLPDGFEFDATDSDGDPAIDVDGEPKWLGEHSFTHLTARELLSADWGQDEWLIRSPFYGSVLPWLRDVAGDDLGSVRLVIGFDS